MFCLEKFMEMLVCLKNAHDEGILFEKAHGGVALFGKTAPAAAGILFGES